MVGRVEGVVALTILVYAPVEAAAVRAHYFRCNHGRGTVCPLEAAQDDDSKRLADLEAGDEETPSTFCVLNA